MYFLFFPLSRLIIGNHFRSLLFKLSLQCSFFRFALCLRSCLLFFRPDFGFVLFPGFSFQLLQQSDKFFQFPLTVIPPVDRPDSVKNPSEVHKNTDLSHFAIPGIRSLTITFSIQKNSHQIFFRIVWIYNRDINMEIRMTDHRYAPESMLCNRADNTVQDTGPGRTRHSFFSCFGIQIMPLCKLQEVSECHKAVRRVLRHLDIS